VKSRKGFIDKVLPIKDKQRRWASIASSILIGILSVLLAVFGMGNYGIAIFVILPLVVGAIPALLYSRDRRVSKRTAAEMGIFAVLGLALLILLCAIEGAICLIMASPIAILMAWVGSLAAYGFLQSKKGRTLTSVAFLILLVPTASFLENKTASTPVAEPVVTSVIIDASPEVVWEYVVAFPELEPPTEFMFKTGIAYPINARIEGTGVGAVRHCNFNTGSFVEPITTWDPPHLLQFDVVEQPEPMKELSFWDVDAPHLHDYFVSKKGQFKLTLLPDGRTELEGTTWYYHNIKPDFYWRLWSNWIVHSIHNRVLDHIKVLSEKH